MPSIATQAPETPQAQARARGRAVYLAGYATAVVGMTHGDYFSALRRQAFFEGWAQAATEKASTATREAVIAERVALMGTDAAPQATASPAEVNALRALKEAADRHGWGFRPVAGTVALAHTGADGRVVYAVVGGRVTSSGPVDMPVELMALLLDAAQATERPEGHRRGR